jgi:hypothetical protein
MLCAVILDSPTPWELIVDAEQPNRMHIDWKIRPGYWLRPCVIRLADSPVYLLVDPRAQPTQLPTHFARGLTDSAGQSAASSRRRFR